MIRSPELNLHHLRVFESVFRTRSMTEAARELHLTQSGVSQHVRGLEEAVGKRLFDRIKKRLVPTHTARELYTHCALRISEIETEFFKLKEGPTTLTGRVSFGMPNEFGSTIVIPLLADFATHHPKIDYAIELGLAPTMNRRLLDGTLDFAIVDDIPMDDAIRTETLYEEIHELCMHPQLVQSATRFDLNRLDQLTYLSYQDGAPILQRWFLHHTGSPLAKPSLRATCMDVHAVAQMIQAKLGAGILPRHYRESLEAQGHHFIVIRGKRLPLTNTLKVAWVKRRVLPPHAESLRHFVSKSLAKQSKQRRSA